MNFKARYQRHFRMVWNLCCTYLKHPADAEDAVQEVFLRLALHTKGFQSHDHERAWLITTAKNVCRDELKRARRRELPLGEHDAAIPGPKLDETLEDLRALPEKYQTALYLHYYEGSPTAQIALLLHRRESTIRSDEQSNEEAPVREPDIDALVQKYCTLLTGKTSYTVIEDSSFSDSLISLHVYSTVLDGVKNSFDSLSLVISPRTGELLMASVFYTPLIDDADTGAVPITGEQAREIVESGVADLSGSEERMGPFEASSSPTPSCRWSAPTGSSPDL